MAEPKDQKTTDEAHANYRFYVEVAGIPQAVFTEVSGMQIETVVQDYEEGGNNDFIHRMPGRTKYGNLTLKYGMTRSNEFLQWYMQIARGEIVRKNISIILYSTDGTEVMRWNYDSAYPVKWVGPQFTADGKNFAVGTVELAHNGLNVGTASGS